MMSFGSPRSLYIHIPFCTRKCLFCSFVVAVGQEHRMDEYLQALEKEAAFYSGATVKSIYIGGGTPSNLNAGALKKLWAILHKHFKWSVDAEISFESNPESIDAQKAKQLLDLGVTRLSLGVQTFEPVYLKFLGRCHDSAQVLKSFEGLRKAGIKNLNVDLMYGFPGQNAKELARDLQAVVALQSEHVSLYTLTIEPNSRFHAQKVLLDDGQLLGAFYNQVVDALDGAGINQYEISNFSRPGFQSKHNRHYWQGGEYIGLGIGAHSYLDGRRFWNVSTLPLYFEKLKNGGSAMDSHEDLTPQTQLLERLLFGLRMNEGVELQAIERATGQTISAQTTSAINRYISDGFLQINGGCLQTTAKGRLVLDELSVRLI